MSSLHSSSFSSFSSELLTNNNYNNNNNITQINNNINNNIMNNEQIKNENEDENNLNLHTPTIFDCPIDLRNYCHNLLQKYLESIDIIDSEKKEIFLESFIDQFLEAGTLQTKNPREYRKWISQSMLFIIKSFTFRQDLVLQVIRQELTVIELLQFLHDQTKFNRKIFADITSHHKNIISQGWNSQTLSNADLEKYALAAVEMGKKDWVIQGNQLIESNILKYFCFGGKF